MTAACSNLEEDPGDRQQFDIRMPKVVGDSRVGQGSKLHKYILLHSGARPLSYRTKTHMRPTCFERLYVQPLSELGPLLSA